MGNRTSPVDAVYVRHRQQLQRVDFDDLLYLRADGNYCYLQTRTGESHTVKWSLRQLLEHLPNDIFMRIHKSYLVNIRHVEALDLKNRELQVNGETLPIGRTYLDVLTEALLII